MLLLAGGCELAGISERNETYEVSDSGVVVVVDGEGNTTAVEQVESELAESAN